MLNAKTTYLKEIKVSFIVHLCCSTFWIYLVIIQDFLSSKELHSITLYPINKKLMRISLLNAKKTILKEMNVSFIVKVNKVSVTILLKNTSTIPSFPIFKRIGPGDLGSIPGRVIPKTQKMVLDASLLNTQHYKVRIKGKVEQSREGVAPSPTPWCSSYWKGTTVANFTLLYSCSALINKYLITKGD